PLDPAVLDAMLPYLREHFGNPSSSHMYGKKAHDAVAQARGQVADFLGAQADEIIFTGGGSEASNLAIKGSVFVGWAESSRPTNSALGRGSLVGLEDSAHPTYDRAHIITSAVEHPATLKPCEFLQRLG